MSQKPFDVMVISEHLKIKRIFGFLKYETLVQSQPDFIALAAQFSNANAGMPVGLPKGLLSRGDCFPNRTALIPGQRTNQFQ